ncbi:MBL fold metallo-hydrolase [bacterium]|nr:MBL fold metallo-hydrolase [bacterium]
MKTYIAGPIDANNYLIWDESTKEAILIDCSDYCEDILNDVEKENLNVKYILLTHGHFDHVMGVNAMKRTLNAQVVLHKNDSVLVENINEFGNIFLGLPQLEIPQVDFYVKEGDVLQFGNEEVRVIYTPGHTEGGVCYKIGDKLFCGDTLFRGSYGRTDLFGGDFDKIKASLNDIILKLDDNIVAYPGHGDETTIKYEKVYNDIMR